MNKKNDIKDYSAFLSQLFLFKGLQKEEIDSILYNFDIEIHDFEANEIIYSPNKFESKVGFVINGECCVEKKKHDGETIPLNKLSFGDSFGIMAVFSKNERFPTNVRSTKHSKILFLDKDVIFALIKKYPEISLAIISFMSDRIDFLNKKIATFSSDTVEEKLAHYVITEYAARGITAFSLNLSKTAKAINAGRASIYRAIESLERLSLIKVENKKINITDLAGLERITQ